MSLSHREPRSYRCKAGDISHPDRVCDGGGPGWHRSCRQSGATRRQRHRPSTLAADLAGKRLELLREIVPVSAVWRSWVMSAIPSSCWSWARFGRQPARSVLKSSHSKSGGRGYRTRFRDTQGPRTMRFMFVPTRCNHQPDSHQHLGARRATANDTRVSGLCRSRRF